MTKAGNTKYEIILDYGTRCTGNKNDLRFRLRSHPQDPMVHMLKSKGKKSKTPLGPRHFGQETVSMYTWMK